MSAKPQLTDSVIIAISQLVDDAQAERRDPSHSDIEFVVRRAGLAAGDPNQQGQVLGKAKRVRAVLNWALENDPEKGGSLLVDLVSLVRGHGGFRDTSPNFVGAHAIANCVNAFDSVGFGLASNGDLRAKTLDGLSGAALTDALRSYVMRAKAGAEDGALLAGTSKDLLEAVAAHVLQLKFGAYSQSANFPTLLGQAYIALGLATPQDAVVPGEPATRRMERAMFELACSVNHLRNKQGTGHGRPWVSTIRPEEARAAVEAMGVVAELLLAKI